MIKKRALAIFSAPDIHGVTKLVEPKTVIRVVLVDDHPVVREGLRSTLPACGPVQIVGEAENGLQAIKIVGETRPDVVLMDVKMPVMNGIDATRRILQDFPECKVLALSMFDDPQYVEEMLRCGCKGYLIKDSSPLEVVVALQKVQAGFQTVSPQLMPALMKVLGPKEEDKRALTEREIQVLKLIAQGFSSKEIGGQLNLSARTVEKHREHISEKIGCSTAVQLVRYAIHKGYVIL